MYTSYFGLNEKPFTITPDPRYLFMSTRHGEALAHLIYGVTESDGFIQLTGEVGTGKTTLVRSLLTQLPDNADVALVLNPQLSAHEFLIVICNELKVADVSAEQTMRELIDRLNSHLLEAHANGRRTILVVDEAQNLSAEVLEQVRLLTNLETTRKKLLQIILIGQPELRDLLSRNDLRQLAQRITARYHLEPLSREEANRYVDHRLSIAGAVGEIFTAKAKREIFKLSKGVPRIMNVICDRALLGAYVRELHRIDANLVREAASEISGRQPESTRLERVLLPAIGIVGVLMIAAGVRTFMTGEARGANRDTVATTVAAPVQREPVTDTGGTLESPAPADPGPISAALEPILASSQNATGTDTAFATLFAVWRTEYRPGTGNACAQAKEHGLDCLWLRGSWNIVRQLNRPVILTLTDKMGEPHQVVLTRLRNDSAQIAIGPQRYELSLDEISEYWFGEYLLLWRPPNGTPKAYQLGMRDPGVLWLRQSLAAIQGLPVQDPTSDLFDEALERRVKDYQRDRRLKVDGLVGQQTQIIIITDLGLDGTPLLVDPTG